MTYKQKLVEILEANIRVARKREDEALRAMSEGSRNGVDSFRMAVLQGEWMKEMGFTNGIMDSLESVYYLQEDV